MPIKRREGNIWWVFPFHEWESSVDIHLILWSKCTQFPKYQWKLSEISRDSIEVQFPCISYRKVRLLIHVQWGKSNTVVGITVMLVTIEMMVILINRVIKIMRMTIKINIHSYDETNFSRDNYDIIVRITTILVITLLRTLIILR